MSLVVLLLVPLITAGLLAWGGARIVRGLHAAALTALLATVLSVMTDVARDGTVTALDGLLRADPLSAWMMGLIAVVATLAGAEAVASGHENADTEATRRFFALFHLFVFTMLLAVTTDDLGLMWVAVEGTTLASVFLVNFHRTRASLEAAYKYLLICSVGIALAFIGTVLVYFADVQQFGAEAHALRWTTLLRWAPQLPPRVVAGLCLPPGRLRDQGGAGAHAHLAPRRAQRGPRSHQCAHVGGAAVGGALRGAALQ